MAYKGDLIVYYSDQRDPAHGQKLVSTPHSLSSPPPPVVESNPQTQVHQVTSDLLTYGPVVNDVAYSTYSWRPGMTTIASLPFGQYILTYEFYGAEEADFAVYYRITTDPLNFNASTGVVLRATDGSVPVSSPYVVWTPVGGPLGTIVVSCGTTSDIYLNHGLGAPGAWTKVETPEGASYSRSLRVLKDQREILVVGGGVLGGEANAVTASVVDVEPKAPGFASCGAEKR